MKNLAIFFSGNGSNMQALINASEQFKVELLICNNVEAKGIVIAENSGIELIIATNINEQDIYEKLVEKKIDYIALAGYNKLIKSFLLEKYNKKIFNIHPSLLPLYRGKDAVAQALANNARITGCTAHLINEEIDKGIILAQAMIPILNNDTIETLHKRILKQEQIIYAKTINKYVKQEEH